MSVSTTASDYAVALYDRTSGLAFGEVFTTAEEADSFLEYMRDIDGRDLRRMDNLGLSVARSEWRKWNVSHVDVERLNEYGVDEAYEAAMADRP